MHTPTLLRALSRVALTVAATLWISGCALGSCGQEPFTPDGGGGDGGTDGGVGCSDPAACMPPVPDHEATGGAAAGVLGDPALDPNAVGGPGATARMGDYYLRNGCVKLVVQAPGRIFSAIPEGGNIIDADIVRPDGEPGADEFGELTAFVNAMLYTVFDEASEVEIVNDGADGAAAVLEVQGGRIDVLEYMNIPAVLYDTGFGSAMEQAINASQPWVSHVSVRVRYALLPAECMVRVTYVLFNDDAQSGPAISTAVGTFYQSAAQGVSFIPGFGFGPISATEAFVTPKTSAKVFANVGTQVAYSMRAYRFYDGAVQPAELPASSQVTISGLTLTVFGETAPLAALSPSARKSPFRLPPQQGAAFEYLVGIGHDLAAAQAAVGLGAGRGHVSGTVTPASAVTGDTRVAVFDDYDLADPNARKVASAFAVRADGTYEGDLLVDAGATTKVYVLEIDAPGYRRESKKVTVTAGEAVTVPEFALPETATINYNVTAGGAPTPCRISVIGQVGDKVTGIRSSQYRDTLFDRFDNGLAYVEVTSVCDSTATAKGTVGPIKVVPGLYRIVVSHGPEFSTVDSLTGGTAVDLSANGSATTVTGDLKRQIGSDGWVSVDLHQHAYYSFDSRLPHEKRLTAYLAEGVEFFGASEHDVIFDYTNLIADLGYASRLATMTGSEISPMHYGHFNAFELTPDMTNPVNFGAPDWSGGPNRTVVTPDELLTWAQNAGADLISANHPRASDSFTYLSWWDRCGFQVTFGAPDLAHAVGCDWDLAAVPADKLDVADGASLWTTKFDLIEIYNRPTPICRRAKNVPACRDGQPPEPCVDPGTNAAGRIFDPQVDLIMQDWFNMLQVGFIRSIVGNSDSHKVAGEIAGVPRSYVFVGSGEDSPSNPQLKNRVKAALKPAPSGSPPRLAAAAVATNGPFVNVTVTGQKSGSPTSATIGGVLLHDQPTVNVAIRVEAPSWMEVDRLELFTNQGLDLYNKDDLRAGARGDSTSVEPRVQTDTDLVVAIPAGAWLTAGDVRYYETTVTVTVPSTTDSWIVVRATGSTQMYPMLPDAACFNLGDDPADHHPFFGTAASAITNPIFVDRDGITGWHGPEAP